MSEMFQKGQFKRGLNIDIEKCDGAHTRLPKHIEFEPNNHRNQKWKQFGGWAKGAEAAYVAGGASKTLEKKKQGEGQK